MSHSAAQHFDLDAPMGGVGDSVEDDGVDELGVLDKQRLGGPVDEPGHLEPRVGVAPQQAGVVLRSEVEMLPVRVEHISDLADVFGVVGDDPVVPGQGEVLDHQVVGGDHRGIVVHHNRLLVCHIEFGARPLDVDSGGPELLVGLVVGPVPAGALGVEHDSHIHTGLVPSDGCVDQAGLGERELLYQQ